MPGVFLHLSQWEFLQKKLVLLHHLRDSELPRCEALVDGSWIDAVHVKERYTSVKRREHQVYVEESGLIHFLENESVRKISRPS